MKGSIFSVTTHETSGDKMLTEVHLCTNGRHVTYRIDNASIGGHAVYARIDKRSISVAPCRGECRPGSSNIAALHEFHYLRETSAIERFGNDVSGRHEDGATAWAALTAEWEKEYFSPIPSMGRKFREEIGYRGGATTTYCLGRIHATFCTGDTTNCYSSDFGLSHCDRWSCRPACVSVPSEVLSFCLGKLSAEVKDRHAW